MKLARLLGVWLLAVSATGALAHAHLEQSAPADESVLASAPAQLVLRFSESVRLAALWVAADGGSRQKLVPPSEPQAKIAVALPQLPPGHYVVGWRAVGADGHVVPGQISFMLSR
jgi:methionine-rich copper-binding protein CopC